MKIFGTVSPEVAVQICPECSGDRFISRRSFIECPVCEGDGCIYDDEPMEPVEEEAFRQKLAAVRVALNACGSLDL